MHPTKDWGVDFASEPDICEVFTRKQTLAHLTCKYLLAYNWPMDSVFKALADPTRRALLDRLYAENGQTLGKLCETLGMSRQAVTQHLAVLEQAQLVIVVWRGREKLHYLNPAPIHEIYERWIRKYDRHRLQVLSDLKQQLEDDRAVDEPNEGTEEQNHG